MGCFFKLILREKQKQKTTNLKSFDNFRVVKDQIYVVLK